MIRLHFTRVAIANFDALSLGAGLYLSPEFTAVVPGGFWTQWFPGPTVNVRFNSDSEDSDFGFKIDQIEYILQ